MASLPRQSLSYPLSIVPSIIAQDSGELNAEYAFLCSLGILYTQYSPDMPLMITRMRLF